MDIANGKEVVFDVSKHLTYIKPLGEGGNGQTHLFFDEVTKTYFAIKKFAPVSENKAELFNRFIDEIKILHNVSHNNICRIYTYYLYPENNLGYLQMEYIDGVTLDKFSPSNNFTYNDLFLQCLNAFAYLESKNILHRDIRPRNIMISNNTVKIIDFGFGKLTDIEEDDKNSVFLNWPISDLPFELKYKKEYNHATEIFILGHVLKQAIGSNQFSYDFILNKMCQQDIDKRYKSFSEILKDLNTNILSKINISAVNKKIYLDFANSTIGLFAKFTKAKPVLIGDPKVIEDRLSKIVSLNLYEEIIQNRKDLVEVFLGPNVYYSYYPEKEISTKVVFDFYKMFCAMSDEDKKIIIGNITNRLRAVKVVFDEEVIPF